MNRLQFLVRNEQKSCKEATTVLASLDNTFSFKFSYETTKQHNWTDWAKDNWIEHARDAQHTPAMRCRRVSYAAGSSLCLDPATFGTPFFGQLSLFTPPNYIIYWNLTPPSPALEEVLQSRASRMTTRQRRTPGRRQRSRPWGGGGPVDGLCFRRQLARIHGRRHGSSREQKETDDREGGRNIYYFFGSMYRILSMLLFTYKYIRISQI